MRLAQLSHNSLEFPPLEKALQEPNGLLAMGGDLSPARMLMAYNLGIFPWFSPGDPVLWWAPDPRAVMLPEHFHLSRSMKRFHQKSPYRVTLNQRFIDVVEHCAADRQEGTWITAEVIQAWRELHALGHAQSVEVWQGDTLVGGLYGLALGQIFCGESMFSRGENASKTALLIFSRWFHQQGGKLIDCQVINPHTASLGAIEISRSCYQDYLNNYAGLQLSDSNWQTQRLF